MNRKQRRAMESKAKTGGAEEALATQAALFSKLPEECTACEAPFDKTDKEMVMSWSVVVREKEDKVNLYCPDCWNGAVKLLGEIKKDLLGEEE